MTAQFKAKLFRKERIELDAEHLALSEHGAVLLHQREEPRHRARLGEHNRLAEEQTALGPADIENVGQTSQVLERHIVRGGTQCIKKPCPVNIKRCAPAAADLRKCSQFRERIDGAVFRRLRDVDHARLHHVKAVAVTVPSAKNLIDRFGRNFALVFSNLDHFVTGGLNGASLMHGNVTRPGRNHALPGFEHCADHHLVGLRSAGKKTNFSIWHAAGSANFFTGSIAKAVAFALVIAACLYEVVFHKRLEYLGVCGIEIVTGKVQHK